MRHNAGRDVESVAEAFYEGPISQVSYSARRRLLADKKNGRRIFYFIVSRVGLVDYDLLAYHVFSVGDPVGHGADESGARQYNRLFRPSH